MHDREVILKVGAEGGGGGITRERDASGSWRYRFSGSSIALDENDDDYIESSETEAVTTFDEALEVINGRYGWTYFLPIEVHPEYRDRLWQLVLEAEPFIPDYLRPSYEYARDAWHRACMRSDR